MSSYTGYFKYLLLTAATNFDNYDGWHSGSGSLCDLLVRNWRNGKNPKHNESKMFWLVWQLFEIWCLTMAMRPNDLMKQNFWLRISMDTYIITTLRRCSELLIKLKASSWESRGPRQEVTAKLLTWPFQSKVSDQESCKIIYLPLLVMSM